MSDVIIQVDSVYKQYRLGQVGRSSLVHDLNRWWYQVRGKEDPYLKIGALNDRTTKSTSDYVWALQNINFEVKRGETIGIVGRNGAGKSTLLKLLSKVTSPTKGEIRIDGRIASLLEVGTGFHPDLSGRQNIFLNGAIMGMKKKEIQRKFDEIVEFAGVQKYIDTPVKRYSSGMYVRLAFAVAAHLEPEILIIDEVLAVGDAEFQKKCLGKMKDVSEKEGRTVLFVSHNMAAIGKLCNTGIYLKNGQVEMTGNINNIIDYYVNDNNEKNTLSSKYLAKDNKKADVFFTKIELIATKNDGFAKYYNDEKIRIELEFSNLLSVQGITAGMALLTSTFEKIFTTHHDLSSKSGNKLICEIPSDILNQGNYYLDFALFLKGGKVFEYLQYICSFQIIDRGSILYYQAGENIGPVRVNCEWYEE